MDQSLSLTLHIQHTSLMIVPNQSTKLLEPERYAHARLSSQVPFCFMLFSLASCKPILVFFQSWHMIGPSKCYINHLVSPLNFLFISWLSFTILTPSTLNSFPNFLSCSKQKWLVCRIFPPPTTINFFFVKPHFLIWRKTCTSFFS